jgi:hypothetical protein
MGWVVNVTSRPIYPRERPGSHYIAGWVGPRAGLVWCGKSRPHRDSIHGPSSRYRVAMPAELSRPTESWQCSTVIGFVQQNPCAVQQFHSFCMASLPLDCVFSSLQRGHAVYCHNHTSHFNLYIFIRFTKTKLLSLTILHKLTIICNKV